MDSKPVMNRNAGRLVRTIRDTAGVIAVIGVAILGGFALTNLKPGWEWTQEDRDEELKNATDDR